ncbi:MAG: hypothetical protein JWM33_3610 [Caulobacteraceae bacterium]|nr:hypothetical protein [Caulobacteraceae bacterium]
MPSVCPTLEKANDARRRAWRELQAIRKMLALVVDDLPPPPKPASFEAEGALLRAALAKAVAEPWRRLAELEAAVEGLKPYLSNTLQDGLYPMRVNDLNRAMHRPRPDAKALDALQALPFGHPFFKATVDAR